MRNILGQILHRIRPWAYVTVEAEIKVVPGECPPKEIRIEEKGGAIHLTIPEGAVAKVEDRVIVIS